VELLDAVILAAGRLPPREAARSGVELKALVPIGGSTPLQRIVEAMRRSRTAGRIIVVGPRSLRSLGLDVDVWVDEQGSGAENVLAGLHASLSRRAILSASDLPFVEFADVDDLVARAPADADLAYPIYERAEFLASFPGGRTRFARVGGAQWTGGSVCLMTVAVALRNAPLIRRGFAARKSQLAMAALLGVDGLLRYLADRLQLVDVERRLSTLSHAKAVAIRGAHPALAMDCDSARDVEYARSRQRIDAGV
jgi:molybdopterin-guanine dinucleotide biosynthesis protein A